MAQAAAPTSPLLPLWDLHDGCALSQGPGQAPCCRGLDQPRVTGDLGVSSVRQGGHW